MFHLPWQALSMRIDRFQWRCWGILALLSGAAVAQTPAQPPSLEGTPAAGHMPTRLQYQSVLQGYRSHADPPLQAWREANDRVGRVGGWRAYAREAAAEGTGQDIPSAAGGHAGHQHPGEGPR